MIYTMNFTMNFTMSYNIAPFSHTFNVQSIWFGKRSESLRASDKPNLISTNERGDNIRPMRRGDYFTIFGSCLRPAVFLGSFSFPLCRTIHFFSLTLAMQCSALTPERQSSTYTGQHTPCACA